jgi:transposase
LANQIHERKELFHPECVIQILSKANVPKLARARFALGTGTCSAICGAQRVRKDHPLRAVRALTDEILRNMSALFEAMYSDTGRPSIAPEKLVRAQLLQMLYSVRSERLLMEEIDYGILYRWFVGLNLDEAVWDATTFTKNRIDAEFVKD